MYLTLIITLAVAFILSLIIFKLLSKTFKLLVFLVVFAVVFGIIYFGYDAFNGKVGNLGDKFVSPATPTPQPSSQGCIADSQCGFVDFSPPDCNLISDSCNYLDPSKLVNCSANSIVVSAYVKCSCKKGSSGSYCEKL